MGRAFAIVSVHDSTSGGCADKGLSASVKTSGSISIGEEGRAFFLESWVALGSSVHSSLMLAIDGRALMLAVDEAVELWAEALRDRCKSASMGRSSHCSNCSSEISVEALLSEAQEHELEL